MVNSDDAGEATAAEASDWWRTAVVYQIYPRSFADADGDGIGDLPGITSRVPYLRALGVDAVWLSPFYPSALADGGYDVDDYRNVDPRLGTLDDFDRMVDALHQAELKVVVDIVPNHTSDHHPWFLEALDSAPDSAARQRYIFRNGVGQEGVLPPNDWESLFGGSAWQAAGDGQWYFHHFAREQPDLNWDDEAVRADFRETLRFWSDRGVDGFRVDVAHGLVKDLSEPFPAWRDVAETLRPDGSHPLWDRDDVHDIYADWRRVFNEYDPPRFAVAEASVHPSRRARYASPEGLGQAFNFEMQEVDWRPVDYRRVIDSGLADMNLTGSTTTWLLGCHDTPRVATRYGLPFDPGRSMQKVARDWLLSDGAEPHLDRQLGERRARAAILILLALPGSTYIYQGDELGLHEVGDLGADVLTDPMAFRSGGREKGRDGCRVPLPWTVSGSSYGFGSGPAHLPQPTWFGSYAMEAEEADPDSTLNLYRRALSIRSSLVAAQQLTWVGSAPSALHFERPVGSPDRSAQAGPRNWHTVTNFGDQPLPLPKGSLLISSVPVDRIAHNDVAEDDVELGDVRLPVDATAWVLLEEASS